MASVDPTASPSGLEWVSSAILDADATRGGQNMVVSDPAEVADWIGDAQPLTDDFAPVDQLLGDR